MRLDRPLSKGGAGFMVTRREFSKCVLAGTTALLAAENAFPGARPAAAPEESSKPDCDLLIKGGTVIDPSQHLHAPLDVAVKDGKILEISQDIREARAQRVFSAKDKIVTPGFIDLHVHCYEGIADCLNADHYCLGRGTTTVVDAGTTGYLGIGRFVTDIVETSLTRVRPLVHICPVGPVTGLEHVLDNLNWVNPGKTAQAAIDNQPAVVGIKVHLSKSWSSSPKDHEKAFLKAALEAAEISRLPLMAHINETYYPLREHLDLMRRGDVFTHCFNGFPTDSPLDANGKVLPEVREARARGVIFDIAAGYEHPHFTLEVAEKCLQQDFLPDTISTDLNDVHAVQDVHDLPSMMSKFLALGMNLDEVIERVTIKPAQVFNFGAEVGTLKPGSEADIGIFELRQGTFEFTDGVGGKRLGHQMLVNHAVVRHGRLFANAV
jgi:dihydroorotase